MKTTDWKALLILPVLILVGWLVAWAGSQGGSRVGDLPLFGVLVGLVFVIQWLAYLPAYLRQTEKFYDLTGSFTYIAVTTLALVFSPNLDARALLLGALVVVWALRLGSFLFLRVHKAGRDDRFDAIKPSWTRFLIAWTLQALWITFTASAAWIAITSLARSGLDVFALLGFLVWLSGFALEVIADTQKSRFQADPANKGQFIRSGLWSRSRHPNYFGEIVLWLGVLIIALPVLQGWQWVALISPLFVTLLLTRVSGIPLLEKKADQKWGGQAAYEAYKKQTPVLIPRLK